MTTTSAVPDADHTQFESVLRDYHEARRREDQWRIPQILLALATPVIALISVIFLMGGNDQYAMISGGLTLIFGTGAALLSVEVWRQHRTAIGIWNHLRTDHLTDSALLLKDPL